MTPQEQKIFDTLTDAGPDGLTLNEIAERIGVNYYTARPYLKNLQEEDRVEPQAMRRGREIVYSVKNAAVAPFLKNAQGQPLPYLAVLEHYAKNPSAEVRALQVAKEFPRILNAVVENSYEAYFGSTFTQKNMMEVRSGLLQHRAAVANLLENLDAILNHPHMWRSVGHFGNAFFEDPDHPLSKEKQMEIAQRIAARYQE